MAPPPPSMYFLSFPLWPKIEDPATAAIVPGIGRSFEEIDVSDATCNQPACEKPRSDRGGVCEMHYYRFRRTGSYDRTRPWHRRGTCSVVTCGGAEAQSGMCDLHSTRYRRHGDPTVRKANGCLPGESNPAWRGDAVTYSSLHQRLARLHGRASEHACIDCGKRADEWSYGHSSLNELLSDEGLPYSTDLEDYDPRCHSCHARFDRSSLALR